MPDGATIIGWITLAVFIAGALLALLRYVLNEIDQERQWREEADALARTAREAVQRELSDFKLYAAQNYVSSISLRETEERLIASNDRLSEYLDKIVNRLDRLSNDMARAGIATVGK